MHTTILDENSATGEGSPPPWILIGHARSKLTTRAFTMDDVLRAVNDPWIIRTQENYGANRQLRIRGQVAVAVEVRRRVILTVLLRTHELWTDEDARQRGARS